jgi:hypothetical protein
MEGIYGGFRGVRGPMGVVACPRLGRRTLKKERERYPKRKKEILDLLL